MSKKYPGGLITKTPVTPSGPYETSSASGIWTMEQVEYWRTQNLWPTAGNPGPDPYYEYVAMLLSGNGTNGATNTTVLDSSTNAYSITNNGGAWQGSFTPYSSNWSNYFNGSSDYLTIADNTGLQLGTGDFTLEMFLSLGTVSASFGGRIFMVQPFGNGYSNILVYRNGSDLMFLTSSSGSGWDVIATFGSVTVGSWNHIAVSRSGNTFTGYLNGTQVFSTTNSTNLSRTGSGARIAQDVSEYFYGYVSNLRLIKGSAIYSGSTITVPTSPLTAVSGTSLLTCQSNRFIDNSSNNATITLTGTPKTNRFSPFNPTAPYSTSTNGGSAYFEGSQTLTVSSFPAIGTGNFTVEAWVYVYPFVSGGCFLTLGSNTTYTNLMIRMNNDWKVSIGNGSSWVFVDQTFGTYKTGAWQHIAIVRNSGTLTAYLNGVSGYSVANSTNLTQTGLTVGNYAGYYLQGYVSGLRITNNAVYTSAFTPPSSPPTAISGTSILCNMTNAGIVDSSGIAQLKISGSVQISTTQSKFGSSSIYFSGGQLQAYNWSDNYYFNTGDFTIEMWVYRTSGGVDQYLYDGRGTSDTNICPAIYINSSNQLIYDVASITRITGGTISANTWTFVTVCRSSGTTKMYINGTQTGSNYTDSNSYISFASCPRIGQKFSGSSSLTGYMQDLRVTNGYARYTTNFTAPTAAFVTF